MKVDAFMFGYQIGRQSSVIWKSEAEVRKPIAYLYNGVRLPALPEWDREAYPYALIHYTTSNGESSAVLLLLSTRPYYHTLTASVRWENASTIRYSLGDGTWEFMSQGENANGALVSSKTIYWTNTDILKENGTVYFAASTPIPIYNEPVNYLYNGVKLPKLPEWDKTVYPYATIWSPAVFGYLSEDYGLVVTSAPLHVVEGTGSISLKSTGEVVYRSCSYDKETETWKQLSDETTETYSKSGGVRWANYDILKANGNLYLEASDPIPIYE